MYKLVVFDVAGTIIRDSNYVAECFVNAFEKHDIAITIEEVNPLMGLKKKEAIAIVLTDKQVDFSDDFVNTINDSFTDEMLNFYATDSAIEILPHVEEIFQFLHEKGIYVALNSGFPKIIVEHILNKLHWIDNHIIDYYIASDEVHKGRPYPLMIHELMDRSGIQDSRQIVKVGDTMVDVQEGRMAKCGLVVSVTTGAYTRKELLQYSPDHVIDDLKELEQFII